MHRYVHRTGVGVIAWRQASGVTSAATLAPRDNHRRIVSRGRVVRGSAGYGVVTGAGNASGSLDSVSLIAPSATASGSASASGSLAAISLTAPTAIASGGASGNAFGTLATISLTPPEATAAGSASAYGSLASVSITAPTATADASGTGNAFATFMALVLTPPEATASGGATATGLFSGISLSPPSATASGGLSAIYPLPAQVLLGVTYGPTGADYTGTATGVGLTALEIAEAVWAYTP